MVKCFIDGIIFLPYFVLLYQQMSAKIYTCAEGLVSLFLCRQAEQSQLLQLDIIQHLNQGGISDHWKDIKVTLALSQPILLKMSALKSRKTHWLPAHVSAWLLKIMFEAWLWSCSYCSKSQPPMNLLQLHLSAHEMTSHNLSGKEISAGKQQITHF